MNVISCACFSVMKIIHNKESSSLRAYRIFAPILWLLIQTICTICSQLLINAIGQNHVDVIVLRNERSESAKKQAKNVFALDQQDRSLLFASVKSGWLKTSKIYLQNQAGMVACNFSKQLFKPVDD